MIPFTEEHRRKLSESHKGKSTWNKGIKQWENKQYPRSMFGKHHSEETKRKMSETWKNKYSNGYVNPTKDKPSRNKGKNIWKDKKHPFLRKKHSEETKKRMSKSWSYNKHITPERILKLKGRRFSLSTEFKKGDVSKFKGYKHKEETKIKISESHKGKKQSEKWMEFRKNQVIPIKDTSIEVKIQNFLRQLDIEFYTHQYIKDIEHGYQCDIFIPSKNLVIECDGNYWHSYPTGKEIDHIRTKELLEKGFKVLRLWESEIKVMQLNEFRNKLI